MRSRGRAYVRSEGFGSPAWRPEGLGGVGRHKAELLPGLAEDEEWNEVVDRRVLAQPLEAIGADLRHVVSGDLVSELAPEGLEGTFDVRVQLGFVHGLSFCVPGVRGARAGPFVMVRHARGSDIVENYG